MTTNTYKGYATTSDKPTGPFQIKEYEPTEFREDFVEVFIRYCGVCSSDVHTLTGGWGEVPEPLVSGHEVAGIVTKVGPKVSQYKEGDRVVIGAQLDSCGKCRPCKDNNENYCPNQVDTYNAEEQDGKKTQGGYANFIRAPEKFVFPVPEGLALEDACSMACGGLTVYSPMVRHGVKAGSKMAVVGLGGLGHYAVLFGVALGADVTVFTHQEDKLEDAKKMGASEAVLTTKEDWSKPYALTFDVIISTIDNAKAIPVTDLTSMLYVNGRLCIVAMPDEEIPPFQSQDLAGTGATLAFNHIGSKKEALEMLQLAADKGVKTWKEIIPMKDVGKAIEGVQRNSVRYRYVLKADLE
ncbi:hypothetical protein JCM8547_007628 [Rhodosporidiobolus lusitaniae]